MRAFSGKPRRKPPASRNLNVEARRVVPKPVREPVDPVTGLNEMPWTKKWKGYFPGARSGGTA